jgi:hypothetical protein
LYIEFTLGTDAVGILAADMFQVSESHDQKKRYKG